MSTPTPTPTITPTPSTSLCSKLKLGQLLYDGQVYNNEDIICVYEGFSLGPTKLNDKTISLSENSLIVSLTPTNTPTPTPSSAS